MKHISELQRVKTKQFAIILEHPSPSISQSLYPQKHSNMLFIKSMVGRNTVGISFLASCNNYKLGDLTQ